MDGVDRRLLGEARNRVVELAMLPLQRLDFGLDGFDVEIHDSPIAWRCHYSKARRGG